MPFSVASRVLLLSGFRGVRCLPLADLSLLYTLSRRLSRSIADVVHSILFLARKTRHGAQTTAEELSTVSSIPAEGFTMGQCWVRVLI